LKSCCNIYIENRLLFLYIHDATTVDYKLTKIKLEGIKDTKEPVQIHEFSLPYAMLNNPQ